MGTYVYKITLLILPVILTLSCITVFQLSAKHLGTKRGYLTGFLFYWIVWCIILPLVLIGPDTIITFFHISLVFDYKIVFCLVALPAFVYFYAFPKAAKHATILVILCSFLLALVNATLEEVLWRTTYLKTFSNLWMSIGYAAFGFALWHYAPQIIIANRNPGGAHSFVLFSFVLGLFYGYAAYRQQSVYWTTLSHTLLDFAGLGALFYFK
jgi:uncharacterized protein